MFNLKIFKGGKVSSHIKDLELNQITFLMVEVEKRKELYQITDNTGQVITTNIDIKGEYKMFKSKYLNNLMNSREKMQGQLIDLDKLREELSKNYNNEYIEAKLKEAREQNAAIKEEFRNNLAALKEEALTPLNEKYLNQLAGSQITEDTKLFTTPGLKLTQDEINRIYKKYAKESNVLMLRFIDDYAMNNNIVIDNVQVNRIDKQIDAVEKAHEYTTNYIDHPLRMAIVEEKLFPSFDQVITGE